MNKIVGYDATELGILVESAKQEAGSSFSEKYISKIAELIKEKPDLYLSFGAYWWLIKQEMINANLGGFGLYVDAEVLEMLDYGNTDLNCAACYTAQVQAFNDYSTHARERAMLGTDGEIFMYSLSDGEMELRILAKQKGAIQ